MAWVAFPTEALSKLPSAQKLDRDILQKRRRVADRAQISLARPHGIIYKGPPLALGMVDRRVFLEMLGTAFAATGLSNVPAFAGVNASSKRTLTPKEKLEKAREMVINELKNIQRA